MKDAVALAWAAGFVDGEGCIHIARQRYKSGSRRPTYQLRLSVAQSDRYVLEHFARVMGVGHQIYAKIMDARMNRQPYCLVYTGPRALAVIEMLVDYLVAKRREAELALAFRDTCRLCEHSGRRGQSEAIWEARREHYERMRALKGRGNGATRRAMATKRCGAMESSQTFSGDGHQ